MCWLAAISLALRDGRPIGGDGVTQLKLDRLVEQGDTVHIWLGEVRA